MDNKLRSSGFWRFQFVFWGIAGAALFVSGATQMSLMQAFVRNLFLLIAGFLSSFFLARLIDELRFMKLLRLRLTSYALAYFIALFCVVVINAITFTLRGVALADLSPGQWFSGTFNLALVCAFWSELFIQRIDADAAPRSAEPRPDKLVLEHGGRLVPVPVDGIDSIVAAGDYVEISTAERSYLHRQTLQALESLLCDERFVRVHGSAIVNRERVESVSPLSRGRYRLHLAGGSIVTSSRGYRVMKPGYLWIEAVYDDGVTGLEGFDGERGREKWGDKPAEYVSGAAARALQQGAKSPVHLYGLQHMAELGADVAFAGCESIDGQAFYVLAVHSDFGTEIDYYLDRETFRLERSRTVRPLHPTVDPTPIVIEERWTDFRMVEGVLHPFAFSLHNVTTGEKLSWLEVHSPARDPDARVATFRKPD